MGWAILLINAIILLLGVMVALKTRPGALWFFVALAALSTVFIGGVLLLNLLAVWLHGGWVRRASARHRRL